MFGKLFGGGNKKSSTTEPPKLASGVREAILNVVGAKSIPAMPGSAQKAFSLATNPKADARDFVELIETDEALSARVLRIANSVFFDRGQKSSTIEQAVVVIGTNELRCLLNANTLCDVFPSKHPARIQLWANDIACALIARLIVQNSQPQLKDSAFLAGLMHDVGKLLLLQRNAEDYSQILATVEQNGIPFCEAESQKFPFDHCEVGHLIAEQWNFSKELVDVISRHHQPWGKISEAPLTRAIKAADHIAHALGLGHPPKMAGFAAKQRETVEETLNQIGISEGQHREFLDTCRRAFNVEYELYTGSTSR